MTTSSDSRRHTVPSLEQSYVHLNIDCSVYLRPGTVCLARALLTAAYRSCLRSISASIVTSHHRQHIQATAVWPHGCSFELNIQSKSYPRLLKAWFHRSDNENVNVQMDVEDLSDGLWRGTIVFDLHAGDQVVSTPKMVSFANISWLEGCFHNPSDENLDHYPRFLIL